MKNVKNKFVKFIKVLLAVSVICGVAGGIAVSAVNIYVKNIAEKRIITEDEVSDLSGFDCILVLGCQVKKGSPSPMLRDRIDRGTELFKSGVSQVIFMTGDGRSRHYNEVGVMKKVAEESGVPEERIVCDGYGLSTYDSIYRAVKLYGYKKIVIVTQEYHLYRALYIAEKMGIEAYGVAADAREYRGMVHNNIRETAARVKDFAFCLVGANAKMGISIWNKAE